MLRKITGFAIWHALNVLGLLGMVIGWPIAKALDFYDSYDAN